MIVVAELWRERFFSSEPVEMGFENSVHACREGWKGSTGAGPDFMLIEPEASGALFHEL